MSDISELDEKSELISLYRAPGKDFEQARNSSELKIRILPHSKHRTSPLQRPRGHQAQLLCGGKKRGKSSPNQHGLQGFQSLACQGSLSKT